MDNQQQEAANQPATCHQLADLAEMFFDSHSSDEIQKHLDDAIVCSAESGTFGDMDSVDRSNFVNAMLNIKTYFAKASVFNDKMKGGKNGTH